MNRWVGLPQQVPLVASSTVCCPDESSLEILLRGTAASGSERARGDRTASRREGEMPLPARCTGGTAPTSLRQSP